MSTNIIPKLREIESRLRPLLPASLYAEVWVDPSAKNLNRTFRHLRTLHRILYSYLPRQVTEALPNPGETQYQWDEGTLMFTDLAGFTPLLEANAKRGREGANILMGVINDYFATMLEIISKSGGSLLEFTGDAMLVQFRTDRQYNDTAQAVRAGLRMQRAMNKFNDMAMAKTRYSLGMRIGIHVGRFLSADIGTPHRMEHVLLGKAVNRTKQAEGAGQVGKVCLTDEARAHVEDLYHFESGQVGYSLVVDDLTEEELGGYDITTTRRMPSMVLFDRSAEGLLNEIREALQLVESLASYIPYSVLKLLVENASERRVPPDFALATVIFVNLLGLPEALDNAQPGEEAEIIACFSRLTSMINAEVEARGGMLKKVTYHLAGSDIMILFGIPNAHTNDAIRAANTTLAIRDLIATAKTPKVGGKPIKVSCQIGMTWGPAFVAEFGEPRGRREFNALGDTVNTAARLMSKATGNQILFTEKIRDQLNDQFENEALGAIALKGKAAPLPLFRLHGPNET